LFSSLRFVYSICYEQSIDSRLEPKRTKEEN
jgi:hypothetical protein